MFKIHKQYLIGHGIDNHKLIYKEGIQQKIAGQLLLTNYKIVAHSDGDIVLHAIADAILGANGLGDLGEWFSDEDSSNKNISSQYILTEILTKTKSWNRICNIDITLICDCIYFDPYRHLIKSSLVNVFKQIKKRYQPQINIKFTRFENQNQTDIQCHCIALLKT